MTTSFASFEVEGMVVQSNGPSDSEVVGKIDMFRDCVFISGVTATTFEEKNCKRQETLIFHK